MTAPPMMETEQEKIRHNIEAYRAAIAAGTHTQQDLDDYLSEVHEARTGKPFVNPSPDAEPKAGAVEKILGTIAATGRDIPGVEAMQAGASALVNRIPYREALSQIRGAEDAAPALARGAARFGGGALAAAVMPGNAIRQGALYGFGHALGNADPDLSLKDRIDNAGVEGATDATIGLAFKGGGALARAIKRAPPGGVKKAAMELIPGAKRFGRAAAALKPVEPKAAPISEAEAKIQALVKMGVPLEKAQAAVAGEAAAPVAQGAAHAVAGAAPKAEGFVGNSMDNLVDVLKANKREPLNITHDTPLDESLKALLARSRETLPPSEAASHLNVSDAEIGMGLVPDENALTLAQQLEESLKHVQQGGTLRSARTAVPTYAGRPIRP